MGDMKTPDFDDLLAAFDIPDIDAKEAIQSSPDEESRDEVRTNAGEGRSGSPSCFSGPPASQSDPPAVSVIVKNTVRSESFEEEDKSVRGKTDNSSRSDSASHDFSSQLSPKLSTEASAEPQISNGFEESKSNIKPWSQSSSLKSSLSETEGDKGAEPGSVQHTADVINSLKPLLYPQPSITAPPTSSPPPLLSPHLSPPSNSLPPLLPQNGSTKPGIKHIMQTDDDDSEPDLGSPLVIQESPEPARSSPPKFKRRAKLPPDLLGSPETSPAQTPTKPQHEEDGIKPGSPPSPPQLQSIQDSLPTLSSTSIHEEKYPEHVIDERDSPESPPPSETGLVIPNRSSSPAPDVNHNDLHNQEEPADTEELKEKVAADGEKLSKDAASASVSESVSPPLRPLKVKIKMPTGSMAKTVTGAAPKRTRRAARKSALSSKPASERHNTRSKLVQSSAAKMLQDAASKTNKPKVSATAVSITKTAALPSVSSSRLTPGAINLRSLGQKTIHGGMALPTPLPLLPPQASSRPASIVNSTGAIISKSQTNLVEAFNKILNNKNLLPCYKPDLSAPLPAEWGLSLPVQGFRCLECGDAFALEQSLAQHYDRRSLRIEVTCNHCAKRLAFFNKCSLLLHAREHKEKGLIMQCSHLVMKPVPVEQMVGQQEHVASGKATPKPTLQNKKAEAAHGASHKCPECLTPFGSKEEVAEHFQEIKPAHSTPCTDCSPPMLLPNGCSSAAHRRIHQSSPPHVCPECGETAKQTLLRTHLEETCLHFSRRIGYRCSSCLVVFGGLNSVKSHMQQAHCDMFHKCPSCPMAFKSAPSIQSHISAQHPTLAQGQPMLIYKCVTCDTVFTQKPLLHTHFDTHLTNQKVHVFKCPECTKLFSQRNSLLDHFKTHKASSVKEPPPSSPPASSSSRPSESSDGEELTHEDEKVKTEKIKRPSSWNCLSCHTRYTDQEDYIAHMREQHGKKLKKFPCNKCENSFTTPSNLTRHIRDKHKAASQGLQCQFCTDGEKTFSSRVMLERHVLLMHIMNPDTSMEGGDEADSSSEPDGGSVARRRRRGAVKTELDEESADGTSTVKKPRLETAPESGLRCAPCGFTTEDQATFLEHISQHRRAGSEGGGLQCLQCGACFTSTSSLSRHRFITHKVKDAFTDGQQAPGLHPAPSPAKSRSHEDRSSLNGSAPASPSGQPEDEGALACKVCGKHFEKAADLNTHFRTHGMAFINARNAGKTI
ncbi:zinc finger protein 687a [Stegastes partitus]|uniref:Zinc finger protein 687 n=1 Tax=Stegastes partitus TaxID=144197 RepID=A0A3B4ZBB8_9TELE|nr:PREDICTED: zinc finger protein 687 [Stegastes partitus]